MQHAAPWDHMRAAGMTDTSRLVEVLLHLDCPASPVELAHLAGVNPVSARGLLRRAATVAAHMYPVRRLGRGRYVAA